MQYGDKKVRYAVIEKDGHLREVVGAQYNSKSETYTNTQPKALVKIKNNGTTANDITLTDTGTNGSYIIKNDSKYVSNFGWIDTNAVSIPSGETIATNGQSSASDKNIVTGNDGQFEITDWSNCKDDELGTAFRGAKCIKIIPSDWPNTNITSLYRTLAGITIDKIPNWTNTNSVLDARELFNGTTINDDLKIDGMIANLSAVTQVKKFLNNCIINKYSYTEGDFKFYSLYKSLLPKIKSITNAAACFGGTQYDKETQTYTDSYNYAVKFKYTDSTGQSANVIPPDLMYIPKEWGGFEHNTFAYVSIDDSTFSNLGLTITDAHLDWNLGSYKTLKYSDSKWIISDNRDFYDSTNIVVECINENTSETNFVIIDKYGSKVITWPDTLDVDDTYTIKIHVYLENPDSKSKPSISGGKIVTDWHEYYLKSDAEYRGTDGVYTRTGLVPYDAVSYDITKCTIIVDTVETHDESINWQVNDLNGTRIDNGPNPPDYYIVTLTNISSESIVYTYTATTSVTVPLYSIPEGTCTDAEGKNVTLIPDGSYQLNIKAYKNDDNCEKNSTITVEDYVSYWADTIIVQDEDAAAEYIFKWTVKKLINDEYVDVMDSYKYATFWMYKWNTETETWEGYSHGYKSPTSENEISIAPDRFEDGKYKLEFRVFSQCHDNSYYPAGKNPDGSRKMEIFIIEKYTAATYSKTTESKTDNGTFALGVYFAEPTTINGFYYWTVNADITTQTPSCWIAQQTDASSTGTQTLKTIAQNGTNLELVGVETTGCYTTDNEEIKKVNFKITNGVTLDAGYYLFCGRRYYQWNWHDEPFIKCSDESKYKNGIIFEVSEWALKPVGEYWRAHGNIVNKYTEVIFEMY